MSATTESPAAPAPRTAPGTAGVDWKRVLRTLQSEEAAFVGRALSVGVALIPIWRMFQIINTSGENTLSDDYVTFTAAFNQMLSGRYNWLHLLHDSFAVGSHSLVTLFLLSLVNIALFHWNIYFDLNVGLVAAVLRTTLLFAALTRYFTPRARWTYLPVLTLLSFGTAQINTYGFSITTVYTNFPQLGLAIGILAAVLWPRTARAVIIMSLAGVFSSWSGGAGLSVWPAFALALVLGQDRRPSHYVILASGAVAGLYPYVKYILVQPYWPQALNRLEFPHAHHTAQSTFVPFVAALGLPLAHGFMPVYCVCIGAAGLIFLALAGIFLHVRHWLQHPAVLPALVLIAYSLSDAALTAAARGGVTPWYAANFVPFWIGLTAIAWVFWTRERSRRCRLWAFALLYVMTALYATSNLVFADDQFFLYLRTHAGASASCLRSYRTAPAYCEMELGAWQPGTSWALFQELGAMLQRHHLSVFGPQERWTLQGDYGLPSVQVQYDTLDQVRWVRPDDGSMEPYSDYRHLNLLLASGNSLSWTLHLPLRTTSATLRSGVELPVGPAAGLARFQVRSDGHAASIVVRLDAVRSRQAVAIPLAQYRGRTITIVLRPSTRGGEFLTYQYPYVDVRLPSGGPPPDVGAPYVAPSWTARDLLLQPDPAVSLRGPREPRRASHRWVPVPGKNGISIWYRVAGGACLADYSHLVFRLAVPRSYWPRAAAVLLHLRNGRRSLTNTVVMPLRPDGRPHTYLYDLKLLPLTRADRLMSVSLVPLTDARPDNRADTHAGFVRLIRRRETSSACARGG